MSHAKNQNFDSKDVDASHVEQTGESKDTQYSTGNVVADNDARGYLNPDIVITEEENKRMRRRIHKRVLPFDQLFTVSISLCVVYVVQSLDKGQLGPASIMGWLTDVNAQGQEYAMTGTLLWIGIMCGEPISNQLVRKLPIAKLLCASMVVWTALAFALAFTLTIPPIWGMRFLLGFFESTFGPCLLSITVQWYTKEEQPVASATWQMMLGLAGSISALFGYSFYHIERAAGLRGWQWMMITVGIISAICTVITWFFLPDSPTRASFLTEEEKTKFVERVRRNDQGIKQKVFRSEQAWEAAKDPLTYLLMFMAISQTMVVGGINTFNALLINRAFGFSVTDSQLLSIPLGAMVVLTYQAIAWTITKTKQTVWTMIAFTIPNIVGTIVLITVAPSASTQGGLPEYEYLAPLGASSDGQCNPAIFLLLARNVSGQSKNSITYATTYIGWAAGNTIAPQLFQSKWAPRYINSLYIHLGLYACFISLGLATRYLLASRNAKKDRAQTNSEGVIVNNNSHAFDDLTDIQNPDFRYSF